MTESFSVFFSRITDKPALPYQLRMAENLCESKLLIVPTGLGKTDAVLLPWLYGRAQANPSVPTRLVLVLPRQNLTTQTAENARKRRQAASLQDSVRVIELLAGSEDNKEDLLPDQPAIIVSTQDLYFSRALNRGYARRPPRWPIDFALYNQDCLIVLDEIQLMQEALATSTQLAAFRREFGTIGAAPCIWMSATVDPAWLRTVDFHESLTPITLLDDDMQHAVVKQRYHAPKSLVSAPPDCNSPSGCAAFVLARHRTGTRSIVVVNTVARAREIFAEVKKANPNCVLLHSRFRPEDRKRAATALDSPPAAGQIIVATQVLEAGVDITARLLVTDLAPWGSLVQRFGRVNRYGDDAESEIYWVEQPTSAKQKDGAGPYLPAELTRAAERLRTLTSAAAADLPPEDGPAPYEYVLRRCDLLDLFDTTPDLGGNELDVSRFIRATDDKDVYLAWRDWQGDGTPPREEPEVEDAELCPVPIGELSEFAKKHRVYTLNFATEEWTEVRAKDQIRPGLLLVTRSTEGGYSAEEGWSPDSKSRVTPTITQDGNEADTDSSDTRSFPRYRQSLRVHTERVTEQLEVFLNSVPGRLEPEWVNALRIAAAKHDWGKAHQVFRETMGFQPGEELLAKQCGRRRHSRPHFRHELASALAMLKNEDADLAVYLVAAHHGKVRLGIRSMPGEREENGCRTARGIREGDILQECQLNSGSILPEVTLSLESMEFGAPGGSWTKRMLKLRDELGPFRLAYLEMLLRAADESASAEPLREYVQCP